MITSDNDNEEDRREKKEEGREKTGNERETTSNLTGDGRKKRKDGRKRTREACEDIDEEEDGREKMEDGREKTTHQNEKTAANEREKREERREKTKHIREMTTNGGEKIDQEDLGDQFEDYRNNSLSEFLTSDNDNEEDGRENTEDGREKKEHEEQTTSNRRESAEDGRQKTLEGSKKTPEGSEENPEDHTDKFRNKYTIEFTSSENEEEGEELPLRKTRQEKKMTDEQFKEHIARSKKEAAESEKKKAEKATKKSKKILEHMLDAPPPHMEAEEIDWNLLPTRRQLALHINHLQGKMKEKPNDPRHRDIIIDQLTKDVVAVWNRCHVVPRQTKEVRIVVKKFLEKKRNYSRRPKGIIDCPEKLVDVALCSCFYGKKVEDMKLIDCKCCKRKGNCMCDGKHPQWNPVSFAFYKDQLHDRLSTGAEVLYGGEEDNGNEDHDDFADDQSPGDYDDVEDDENLANHHEGCCDTSDDDTDVDNDDPKDRDYIQPASGNSEMFSEEIYKIEPPTTKNMTKLKATSSALSRTMVSSRKAALIINAYLEDLKLLNEKRKACPKKLYNARVSWGKECITEKENLIKRTGGIQAIYLDERKDFTTVNQLVDISVQASGDTHNGKNRVSRMIKEEHCKIKEEHLICL